MSKVTHLTISTFVSGYACQKFASWTERTFPPEKLPALAPRPGYKVYGYMGCPQSKIEAIKRQKRNLFFDFDPVLPQHYALSRTRIIDRFFCKDRPVVLQIEIPEDKSIDSSELWKDPSLNQPNPLLTMNFVSFHPAVPPEVQKKYGLEFRVHHVVTCNLQQNRGSFCRLVKQFLRSFERL